jgi:hypothetical protein
MWKSILHTKKYINFSPAEICVINFNPIFVNFSNAHIFIERESVLHDDDDDAVIVRLVRGWGVSERGGESRADTQ